ncbi:MAG: HTH domain-containing protein, partial [Peptostreptococcus anaerobius]
AHGVAQDVAHGVAQDVAHGVAQDVAHGVAHSKIVLIEFIKEKIRGNDKITRKAIADEAGVSVKTIERTIKEIDNLQYVGSGNNGHWELNE